LDLRLTDRGFKSYSGQKLRKNLGQVVHTYVQSNSVLFQTDSHDSTVCMQFLMLNQQHQSTEGNFFGGGTRKYNKLKNDTVIQVFSNFVCYCAVDSELCHKFTQMLVDKKQVVTLLLMRLRRLHAVHEMRPVASVR